MKNHTNTARRVFLQKTGLFTTALYSTGFTNLAFSQTSNSQGIVVVIFQRGGCDGLGLLVPSSTEDSAFYQSKRPMISQNPTLALPGENRFRLNSAMQALLPIWDSGNQGALTFFPATHTGIGKHVGSTSHFAGQELIELGGGGNNLEKIREDLTFKSAKLGLAARTLEDLQQDINLYSFAQNKFLQGNSGGVVSSNARTGLNIAPDIAARNSKIRTRIANDNSAHDLLLDSALNAQAKIDHLKQIDFTTATAPFTNSGIGRQLRQASSMIKSPNMDKLEMVFLDHGGGYDTHSKQTSRLNSLLSDLANNLKAFHDDLVTFHKPVEVIVLTEFGRTVDENGGAGTDHGQASCAIAMGTGKNGQNKKNAGIIGNWSGLEAMSSAYANRFYLDAITDYRDILSESIQATLQRSDIQSIFGIADSTYAHNKLNFLNYS